MPASFTFSPKKTAKDQIEKINKILKSSSFQKPEEYNDESRKALYCSVFALRTGANAERGKKRSLNVKVTQEAYDQQQKALMESASFGSFLKEQGEGKIQALLTEGHGGAAEDAFKNYVLESQTMPQDVPERYMPTVAARIQQQQKKLNALPAQSKEATEIYAEIFRTRRSVNAVRKQGALLEVKLDGKKLAEQPTLKDCESFKKFVDVKGPELKQTIGTGHGGAAEQMFQDYLLTLDHMPTDVPAAYMPTGLNRTEILMNKLRSNPTPELYAELLATRESVDAERGKKSSLDKVIDQSVLSKSYEKWSKCETFKRFLNEKPGAALSAATTGHGGKLQDEFRSYVRGMDHIPGDVPPEYMPSGLQRIDALKEQLKNGQKPFVYAGDEDRLKLAAEIMGTRDAVEAIPGDSKSLDKPIDPKKLEEATNKWMKCEAFKDFVTDPAQTTTVLDAMTTGHGGSLAPKFREYILKRPKLEANIPQEHMPKAAARIDVLKERIEKNNGDLAANCIELISTRRSVGAVRGKGKSLEATIDVAALAAKREKLEKSELAKEFFGNEANRKKIRDAALKGHGGALEDLFQEYINQKKTLPEDLPEDYIPTAASRIEALQKEVKKSGLSSDQKTTLYAQILAARNNVGAIRKNSKSLEPRLDAKAVNQAAQALANCQTFKDYVKDHPKEAADAADSGHAGLLDDKFREYVCGAKSLPEDLPEQYIPTALERIQALQKQIDSKDFANWPDTRQIQVLSELLAARRSVGAIRGKEETLSPRIPTQDAATFSNRLQNCEAFKNFVRTHPDLAKKAACSGHGGALEDAFKKHVLTMDHIPADVPKEYMPTALERTEALIKLIKSPDFSDRRNFAQQNAIFKELCATRAAVNSTRNVGKSLDLPLDAAKLNEIRTSLNKGGTDDFFENANRKVLKDSATSGHGGALEDKLKEDLLRQAVQSGSVPEAPARYLPESWKLRDEFKKSLASDLKDAHHPHFSQSKDVTMRKMAGLMYLSKLEREGGKLDPAEMKKTVDVLVKSNAFKQMFQAANAPRELAQLAVNGKISEVWTRFANHGGQLQQQHNQPQLQVHPVQAQQNQAVNQGNPANQPIQINQLQP